jgi:hypothetical protein
VDAGRYRIGRVLHLADQIGVPILPEGKAPFILWATQGGGVSSRLQAKVADLGNLLSDESFIRFVFSTSAV